MKLLALATLLPPTIHAACYTPPEPHISNKEIVYPQKRTTDELDIPPPDLPGADLDLPGDDPTTGPSPISIDLPPQFLPPPWSPFSELDSPYPSGGVSPWDDSGRAQMVDNEPSMYNMCPRIHLDCRKCPLDPRCTLWLNVGDGPSAPIAPEDDGNGKCPLYKCDADKTFTDSCGKNARCTRGYCVCDLGWRGVERHGMGYRGNEGLGALTVYLNPGELCDVKCDSLSCKEVPQLDVGACWKSDGIKLPEDDSEWEESEHDLGSGLGTVVDTGAVGQVF